jgi:hypothetical protein
MKIAIVNWKDTQTVTDGIGSVSWLSKEEFKNWCEEPLIVCQSVGWLTYECDEFIVLTQTEFDGATAESTKIPRNQIVKITAFKWDGRFISTDYETSKINKPFNEPGIIKVRDCDSASWKYYSNDGSLINTIGDTE